MFQLHAVDFFIIIFYFAFVLGVGWYLKRRTKSGLDFFLAGRSQSAWVAAISFMAASMGALELMGWSAATYQYGLMAVHWYWIGVVPAMLFLGLFMMPFYYISRTHSVPGYLKLRFGESSRVFAAVTFVVMTLLASGISIRGKYTLLRIPALAVRLEAVVPSMAPNNPQGTSAVNENKVYGISFSVGTFSNPPNMTENTIICIKGWRTAQPAPRMVCLYRTRMSLQARNHSNSRRLQSSRKFKSSQPVRARMRVTAGGWARASSITPSVGRAWRGTSRSSGAGLRRG